jgi:hypothetical protein
MDGGLLFCDVSYRAIGWTISEIYRLRQLHFDGENGYEGLAPRLKNR